MEKYISKSALIAEIEKRIKELQDLFKEDEKKLDSFQKTAIHLCIDECKVILNILDSLEVKEIANEKVKWSPNKKQIESLKDMLKYNIGVFDYQKFIEVNSLYDDLKKLMKD